MTEQEIEKDSINEVTHSTFQYPLERYFVYAMAVEVFQSVLDEVGAHRTLEACKQYANVWGLQAANLARQRFGLVGTDLEDVALPYYWVHYGTSFGHIKPMEIRDGKAIVELYACPNTVLDAPPEICIAMSHYIADGMCQAINPNYEFIYTHHLNHDDRCRYIVKKKSEKVDFDNPGSLQKIIPLDLSQDEIHRVSWTVCYTALNMFTSLSIDLLGSEHTLELALPQARELGLKLGKHLMDSSEGNGNIQTIREKLDYLNSIQSQIGTPTIASGEGLEREIKDCPYKGSPTEVCQMLAAISNGVCEAINPDYEFSYDRMMSRGEHACHWYVRKKGGGPEG